jgi:hypothetical protein
MDSLVNMLSMIELEIIAIIYCTILFMIKLLKSQISYFNFYNTIIYFAF